MHRKKTFLTFLYKKKSKIDQNLFNISLTKFQKSQKNFFFFKASKPLRHNRSYMYELLGVEKDCTNEQIKSAYIKLARQYHPEINKDSGAEEMFRSLTNAYEALSNQRNRDLYNAYMELDLYDPDWLLENEREKMEKDKDEYSKFYENLRQKAKNNFHFYDEENINFNNGYENVFNSGYKEPERKKAEDVVIDLELNLLESYLGVDKIIEFSRKEKCRRCDGNRSEIGTRPSKCFVCKNTGRLKSKNLFKFSA